jgi:fibro-slime domain-containing protein
MTNQMYFLCSLILIAGCDANNGVILPPESVSTITDNNKTIMSCGNGAVDSNEECDDGNVTVGDGCDSYCRIESGFKCIVVPVIYRDFKEEHYDFEPGGPQRITGCDDASMNMISGTLDADGKPTLGAGSTGGFGCNYVTSADTFAEWYRDVPGINYTISTTITLWDNGEGSYVNRNGSPTFFPIDDSTFDTARSTASVPVASNTQLTAHGGWQDDPNGVEHNFWFTGEIRFLFVYNADIDQILEITSDDDSWVFINNHLAVDLGGLHTPLNGSVNIHNVATHLGLSNGNTYEIVIFHAERQTNSSIYKITLTGFNTSICQL